MNCYVIRHPSHQWIPTYSFLGVGRGLWIYVLRIAMMRNASIITDSRFGMGFELVYGKQHQINLKLKGN